MAPKKEKATKAVKVRRKHASGRNVFIRRLLYDKLGIDWDDDGPLVSTTADGEVIIERLPEDFDEDELRSIIDTALRSPRKALHPTKRRMLELLDKDEDDKLDEKEDRELRKLHRRWLKEQMRVGEDIG